MMAGAQQHTAFLRLALAQALGGWLDAVVDGIAQQVGQRRFQALQHVAVDLGVLTFDVQAHLFAQRAAEVAQHAGLATQHIGEGTHARGQGQVIELLGALTTMPDEVVEQLLMRLQLLLAFDQQVAALVEQRLGGGIQLAAEQMFTQ